MENKNNFWSQIAGQQINQPGQREQCNEKVKLK